MNHPEFCEAASPSFGRPSDAASLTVSSDPRPFDFCLLFGAGFAALLGMYLSISGFHIGPPTFALVYFVASPAYAALTAAIAASVPRKVGLPMLPIFESWRAGSLSIRKGIYPVAVGVIVGIIASCAALFYGHRLIKSLGGAVSKHHFTPNVLGLVSAALLEEILFRAVIFAVFVALVRWAGSLTSRARLIPIWLANAIQALLFGGGHVAVGRGLLAGRSWYIRILLVSQTWTGLLLGCVYWKYGIESAIVCHITFDLVLLALTRGGIHLSHL
jgi:hypothetical protein